MTRFEALLEQRRQLHLKAAIAAWQTIHAQLAGKGIEHELFGSLAKGDFREHSDIDLMILGKLTWEERAMVRRIAEDTASNAQVALDLFFAEDFNEKKILALLEH
ncbi:nucleotidyltransferase domain-containing protein [Leisingera sp. M658]|uniref:nucleotidyltransferase domain-containing protein n=1 Tax=Leisingera sp. M658 TaxID=2867015 RepID=UPI0021A7F8A4|nr:nucleotidyltransferase domain-containing protein [Leisingera sp. M658]UWQ74423.1 nucleotidyltransferase domain-containing protein [Leisingera sp. M658]